MQNNIFKFFLDAKNTSSKKKKKIEVTLNFKIYNIVF